MTEVTEIKLTAKSRPCIFPLHPDSPFIRRPIDRMLAKMRCSLIEAMSERLEEAILNGEPLFSSCSPITDSQ